MSDSLRALQSTTFARGSNCAQSVLAHFAQHPLLKDAPLTPAVGAGFGGGLGNTGCLCGALAGAVMVAGYYAGTLNLEPVAERELSEKLTKELERRFKERYQATCCRVIRRKYCEGTADASHCNALVNFMIEQTEEVLAQHHREFTQSARTRRWHALDIMNGAEYVATALFFVIAFITLGGLFAVYNPALRALCAWSLFLLGIFLLGMRLWRILRYYRRKIGVTGGKRHGSYTNFI